MRNGFVRALVVLGLAAGAAVAGDPVDALVKRSYPVADLVAPWPKTGEVPPLGEFRPVPPPAAPLTPPGTAPAIAQVRAVSPETVPDKPGAMPENADKLVRLVTTTVTPYSWEELGGPGTAAFDPSSWSLVVRQTPAVHREIGEMLVALRRLQEKSNAQVALEVRVVEVTDNFFERVGADFGRPVSADGGKAPVVFLSDKEARQFLEAVQGDRRANVVQAPKITAFDGQPVVCRVGETVVFQTGLELAAGPAGVVRKPRYEAVDLGTRFAATPTVSADRRTVGVKFRYEAATIGRNAPVTTAVIAAGGLDPGKTTTPDILARPAVSKQVVVANLSIPDGATALMAGPAVTREERTEFGPPVVSNIPYVNRLFVNQGISRETRRQLVLVTARVLTPKEEAAGEAKPECPAAACRSCVSLEAARLVAEYRKACDEGKTEEAIKLAMKALAVDPKCFTAGK